MVGHAYGALLLAQPGHPLVEAKPLPLEPDRLVTLTPEPLDDNGPVGGLDREGLGGGATTDAACPAYRGTRHTLGDDRLPPGVVAGNQVDSAGGPGEHRLLPCLGSFCVGNAAAPRPFHLVGGPCG